MSEPETYGGEAPHVDVPTSRRAADEAFDKLATRQKLVLIWLGQEGRRENGGTVKEFRDQEKFHHGTASSLFTTLHMRGRIVALTEARDGATIYTLPEYVNGRETRPYARMKRKGMTADIAAVLVEHRLRVSRNWGCNCGQSLGDPSQEAPVEEWAAHVAEEITKRIG